MKNLSRIFALTIIAGAIAACGSDSATVTDSNAPVLSDFTLTEASDAGPASLLGYSMPGIDGAMRRENAVVVLPTGDAPEGGWPVIGWGHGTTGVADACAPSATENLSGYAEYLNAWLAAGYAIVAPDYEGLGTDGGHPYLHLDSEGRSINYAVAAAVEAMPELSNRYALLGHSQGGHAVLGAASLADENPDITLVAAVALAPASQVLAQGMVLDGIQANADAEFTDRVAAAIGDLGFSSLLLQGTEAAIPAFDLDAAYGENGAELRQLTETACLPQITAALTESVPPVFQMENSVDSFIPSTVIEVAEVVTYFESVEPGNRAMQAPLFIAQGLQDTTVFPSSSALLQTQLSAQSETDPVLTNYENTDHGSILLASFNDAVAFVGAEFMAEQ